MNSARDTSKGGGFPHSEIPGSKSARLSPGLIAACHVLHRLSAPRHPPDALLLLYPAPDTTAQRTPPDRQKPGENPHAPWSGKHTHAKTSQPSHRGPARIPLAPAIARSGQGGTRPRPSPGPAFPHDQCLTRNRPKTGPVEAQPTNISRCRKIIRPARRRPPRRPTADVSRSLFMPHRRFTRPTSAGSAGQWWARADSNGRPHPYQGCALTG
jgi:hypothetical protein